MMMCPTGYLYTFLVLAWGNHLSLFVWPSSYIHPFTCQCHVEFHRTVLLCTQTQVCYCDVLLDGISVTNGFLCTITYIIISISFAAHPKKIVRSHHYLAHPSPISTWHSTMAATSSFLPAYWLYHSSATAWHNQLKIDDEKVKNPNYNILPSQPMKYSIHW